MRRFDGSSEHASLRLGGHIPLDVWVEVALRDEQRARQIIDAVPEKSLFAIRNDTIEAVDWESCSTVLDSQTQLDVFLRGWQGST